MTASRTPLGSSYRKLYLATAISNLGDGMASIAYPWLASVLTRSPMLVALVAAAQRLPWLVFTLPAGVIADRVDRRRAMVAMDLTRGCLTLVVAFAVLAQQGSLPAPDRVADVVDTRVSLYAAVVISTLLLGCAEVLRDNAGQTFLPSIVEPAQLERANGNLWSVEAVANTFIGPPIGSLLLMGALCLPFLVDATSFIVAAALVGTIPGTFRVGARTSDRPRGSWRAELSEGVRWLVHQRLLRTMAIILGLMNLANAMSSAVLVLFAQEVLGVTPLTFTFMGFGFAVGAIVGGQVAPWMSRTWGSGTCLSITMFTGFAVGVLVGVAPSWPLVAVTWAIGSTLSSTWNVITVSLRQTIIPPSLMGRVNSVYRLIAWGAIPVGAVLGGLIVTTSRHAVSTEWSLRAPWFADAAIHFALFVVGSKLLTTSRLEAARATATGTDADVSPY